MQRVKKVAYCHAKVPQRKGQGARMLGVAVLPFILGGLQEWAQSLSHIVEGEAH